MHDIIIIGGGPAGLTAAIYALRAGKSVLLCEKGGFGGQMTYSPKIENYPGYTEISGSALADKMVEQALFQGAEMEPAEVSAVIPRDGGYTVKTDTGDYEASAVIIAAGAKHRLLGVPGEDRFIGNGISFCAVCDGSFYAGQDVAVIGGGNSALQEALQLSDVARNVTVVQNLDTFTGEGKLAEALALRKNTTAVFGTVVKEFTGNGELDGVILKNEKTGEESRLAVTGVFIAVGLVPEARPFSNVLKLDRFGYAVSDERCEGELPGVFVAGDCRTKTVRQISTAAADGAAAALAACAYIDKI